MDNYVSDESETETYSESIESEIDFDSMSDIDQINNDIQTPESLLDMESYLGFDDHIKIQNEFPELSIDFLEGLCIKSQENQVLNSMNLELIKKPEPLKSKSFLEIVYEDQLSWKIFLKKYYFPELKYLVNRFDLDQPILNLDLNQLRIIRDYIVDKALKVIIMILDIRHNNLKIPKDTFPGVIDLRILIDDFRSIIKEIIKHEEKLKYFKNIFSDLFILQGMNTSLDQDIPRLIGPLGLGYKILWIWYHSLSLDTSSRTRQNRYTFLWTKLDPLIQEEKETWTRIKALMDSRNILVSPDFHQNCGLVNHAEPEYMFPDILSNNIYYRSHEDYFF